MTEKTKLTYKQSGVDYDKIDPLKVMAQKAARGTAQNLLAAGFQEVEASRGESAYVIDVGDFYLASITECLGTDFGLKLTGYGQKSFFIKEVLMKVNFTVNYGSLVQIKGRYPEHIAGTLAIRGGDNRGMHIIKAPILIIFVNGVSNLGSDPIHRSERVGSRS